MARREFRYQAGHRRVELGRRTRLMAVVNLTPDSFYAGSRVPDPDQAVERCLRHVEEGADFLDLGGESSRPGAQEVSVSRELKRVIPVLERLRPLVQIPISVDTYKAEVAEAALEAGADIINDISAFRLDGRLAEVVARRGAGVILMHMRGTPRVMQQIPASADIVNDIRSGLEEALLVASACQIARDKIILDPGIGFGKTAEDNLLILNRLHFLEEFGLPIMVGTSRKSFLGRILRLPEEERLWGTAASVTAVVLRGAHIVRVHDVKEIRMVLDVSDAIVAESLL